MGEEGGNANQTVTHRRESGSPPDSVPRVAGGWPVALQHLLAVV